MFHTSLEDEQQLAELTGWAQTASRMAVLLYDIEAGQHVQLTSVRNERLTGRALRFLQGAERASDSLEDYPNKVADLLGSETPDVSYYKYYIEAKRRMGDDPKESDKELKTYVATLSHLAENHVERSSKRLPRKETEKVRHLADFFLWLGRTMLGQVTPHPPLEPYL